MTATGTRPAPRHRSPARARTRGDGRPIDPRIQARRRDVRRRAGRRRLRRLLWFGALLGLIATAVAVVYSPLLAVHRIDVHGAHHTSPAAVRRAAGIEEGRAMVSVTAGTAADRIERLPWVAAATVSRHWPTTVRITVRERRPVALLPAPGGASLVVDADGHVLRRITAGSGASAGAGLAKISTDPVQARLGQVVATDRSLLHVAAALPGGLRRRVQAVAHDGAALALQLQPCGEVRLGDATQLSAKMVAAMTVLGRPEAADAPLVDVEVPAAPTLTTARGCA